MKIAEILNIYLSEDAEANVISIKRTRSAITKLTEHLGNYPHMRLTPRILGEYRKQDSIAPGTYNRELGVLSAALRYSMERHYIQSMPQIRKRRGAGKRTVWLRPEQVDDLLSSAKHYPGVYEFVKLSLLTGQRMQAILGLRWSQVDWKQRIIWFNEHDLILAERRKGRGKVPFSAGLEQLLLSLQNSTPHVLLSSRGSRFQVVNPEHWRAIVTAAGLPDLKPHDLRHTVATNLLRQGTPLIEVSKLLGHANTQVTERIYVHFQPEFLRGAVNRLDTLVGGMTS